MERLDIDAVVFDMDGVLVDTEELNIGSAAEAFEDAGHPLSPEHSRQIVGRHPDDYLPDLARRFSLSEKTLARIRERQDRTYARLWREHARLQDGARDVLSDLRERRVRLGVATSGGRKHVTRCLDRFSIGSFFEIVVTKDDVSKRKPDPEIYLTCAERLDLEPSAVLAVEDSEHGVRSAKAAGVHCIAVTTPHTPLENLKAADAVIRSLRELAGLLA